MKQRNSQKAVALVTTLIMLSVVTFLAIAFLSVSRRERGSVDLSVTQTDARFMAEMGLARAQAEMLGRMLAHNNRYNYGFTVSTNYISPTGFVQGVVSPLNVNYDFLANSPVTPTFPLWAGGSSLTENELLQNLANLQYDPRPPVFITNALLRTQEFRFYIDINRNGTNERNGLLPEIGPIPGFTGPFPNAVWYFQANNPSLSNNIIQSPGFVPAGGYKSNFFVGDPEWIGVLADPSRPHGPLNQFIGRYAYMMLPAGMSLDLNYMHNQVKAHQQVNNYDPLVEGFLRNQGVGPWEMNLGAFLADLNTNTWDFNGDYGFSSFRFFPTAANPDLTPSLSSAMLHAKDLLRYRYNSTFANLATVNGEFFYNNPANAINAFANHTIDAYCDGPIMLNQIWYYPALSANIEPNQFTLPPNPTNYWVGSANYNSNALAFQDIQELFAPENPPSMQVSLGKLRTYAGPGLYTSSATLVYSNFLFALTNTMTGNLDGRRGAGFNKYDRSSYDRYTYHRLLAQMGVDSPAPQPSDKINLNYDNAPYYDVNGRLRTNSALDFIPWTAQRFFAHTADRLLRLYSEQILTTYFPNAQQNNFRLSITNIPLFPGSFYKPEVHRLLQLAANIYDATSIHHTNITNAAGVTTLQIPNYPSVFRPIFYKTNFPNGQVFIFITGYEEVGPALAFDRTFFSTNTWYDLDVLAADPARSGLLTDVNIRGVPIVIGAKKGYPNFNEFSMQTVFTATRKLEMQKVPTNSPTPNVINQIFALSVSNLFGMELWNSYKQAYPRPLRVLAAHRFSYDITNQVPPYLSVLTTTNRYFTNYFHTLMVMQNSSRTSGYFSTNIAAGRWRGGEFLTATTNASLLPFEPAQYVEAPNAALAAIVPLPPLQNAPFQPTVVGFPIPRLGMTLTNDIDYVLIDTNTVDGLNRIVDYVSMTNLSSFMDFSAVLFRQTNALRAGLNPSTATMTEDMFWNTNFVTSPSPFPPTLGVSNQILFSMSRYNTNLSSQSSILWRRYNGNGGSISGYPRTDPSSPIDEIDFFRSFMGLPPFVYTRITNRLDRVQVPYAPTRKVVQTLSWAVNDPFVHYTAADLRATNAPPQVINLPGLTPPLVINPYATEPAFNIGRVNPEHKPWGGYEDNAKGSPNDTNAYNLAIKDPGIRRSDDWEFYTASTFSTNVPVTFPTNKFANVGWLGRVHRGSPWQTVYMKSPVASLPQWFSWSGNYGAHPTNDWRLFDIFTTALGDNGDRGQLSVNQTNVAAWSAVFSGVTVLSNTLDVGVGFQIATATNFHPPVANFLIRADSFQLYSIVNGLNRTRAGKLGQAFTNAGGILAAPELTVNSPYLRIIGTNLNQIRRDAETRLLTNYSITDLEYERIPQQIMSLVTLERQPRVVIYAWGQSLKPAEQSLYLVPGAYFRMCTNYQITGEVATRTVLRIEGLPDHVGAPLNSTNPVRTVVESFNILPATDY